MKMAVLQKIIEFFAHPQIDSEAIVPAPETVYEIRPLTEKQIKEVWKLNQRCFKNGENYPLHTLEYLLTEANTLSYRAVTPSGELVGFVFITLADDGAGHITTIGTAPEHRRRGIARQLMERAEEALRNRKIATIFLEVRMSNTNAQNLYRELGFSIVQRLPKYYNNGEDGYLMVKSLIV
jgi:ribosomal-protein-alanine N-acetyltransferase